MTDDVLQRLAIVGVDIGNIAGNRVHHPNCTQKSGFLKDFSFACIFFGNR